MACDGALRAAAAERALRRALRGLLQRLVADRGGGEGLPAALGATAAELLRPEADEAAGALPFPPPAEAPAGRRSPSAPTPVLLQRQGGPPQGPWAVCPDGGHHFAATEHNSEVCGACGLLRSRAVSDLSSPFVGLPRRPLADALAARLYYWGSRGDPGLRWAETAGIADSAAEAAALDELIAAVSPAACEAAQAADAAAGLEDAAAPEQGGRLRAALRQLLDGLGAVGVLRLLGCRATAGTRDAVERHGAWPPSRGELLAAAARVHSRHLTVCARALAKHTVRHQSWWGGELGGSEERKSHLAQSLLTALVDSATWLNVHMLPHGLACCELRCGDGYGARWVFTPHGGGDTGGGGGGGGGASVGQLEFRGFLEPQMAGGHEAGWRH